MIRKILFSTCVASLGIALACQSGSDPAPDRADAPAAVGTETTTDATTDADGVMLAASGDTEYRFDANDASEPFVAFATNAFPPLLPVDDRHANPWDSQACLMCHEAGVGDAPAIVHADMSRDLLKGACRTCHVQVPMADLGEMDPTVIRAARPHVIVDGFTDNAFPPVMPATDDHANAWLRTDCLACHERGLTGTPRVVHQGMSKDLLVARCRTCHLPGAQEDL